MDISKLKKKVIGRVVVYAAVLSVIILACIYLGDKKTQLQEQNDRLRNDISSLNKKLEGLSKKALEFSESIKVWETLDEQNKVLNGLRINDAKDLLDKLKEEYRLSGVNLTFSKPEDLKDQYVSDTIIVVSSDVSIQFSAMTDEYLFGFVDKLLSQYPGYVQVRSFSVTRSKNITKDVLLQIAAGENPGLVDCKLDFVWRGLKYKGPVTPAEDNDNNG